MKINSIAPQYHANQVKYIQNNNLENKTQKQAFNTNPNITSPIKQDALSHLAFLGIQNLKYTANVTFKGNNTDKNRGYIQVYTGDGKGKTTAAMGLALRALGQGKTVDITMFTKGGDNYGEVKAFNKLQPELRKNLTLNQAGLDRIVYTSNETENDRIIMQKGWENAKKVINSGKTDIVILDEMNIAIDLKMIDEKDVIETLKNKPKNVEEALEVVSNGKKLSDIISEKVATIGEKLSFRRFEVLEKEDSQIFGTYSHMGGKIVTLVVLEGNDVELAKDIAMQAAAMRPLYLNRDEVPAERIEKERAVLTEQAENEGLDQNKLPMIVNGRLNKFFEEICLVDQGFIKENKMKVSKYVESKNSNIIKQQEKLKVLKWMGTPAVAVSSFPSRLS